MEAEVKAAAAWWADVLRGPANSDNGDAMCNAFASVMSSGLPPLSEGQIEMFRVTLESLLPRRLRDGCWDEAVAKGDPNVGCHGRCLRVDYDPDAVLAEAATRAGITGHMLRFPFKTTMWVNPGKVTVRRGYGAGEQTVYQAAT